MDESKRTNLTSRSVLSIANTGYPFIFGAAFVTIILALLDLTTLTLIGLVITFAFGGFFRDPERIIPEVPGAVVSPADGKVITSPIKVSVVKSNKARIMVTNAAPKING